MAATTRKQKSPHRNIPLCPLGERIDALSGARGLSRNDLAAASGLSRQTIGLILNGTTRSPSAESAIAIARALGVSVEALFAGTGSDCTLKLGRPAIIPLSPFGAKLIRRMDVLGVTRDDLSKRTGIDSVTIWRWMKGKSRVPLDSACRLARALHCPVTELQSGLR
ncbi:MAG: Helix-turn-helix domain [Verrucomicrobiota bacterium]|jgi:transcriptional regulator with XRE-family HTH domain